MGEWLESIGGGLLKKILTGRIITTYNMPSANIETDKKKTTRQRKKEIELDDLKAEIFDQLKTWQEMKLKEPKKINEVL
ncbi:hypothetical protein NDU88_004461 [Pleurodeles waltl]|uniref:Uncharacterized protein n=1 Tax=Pleurodeles waltl TaxID=8319 RepID=A0AAV7W8B9_PLEWA|nr:hypothetical protein NDU88_004461 [Pleurodeles waltl]